MVVETSDAVATHVDDLAAVCADAAGRFVETIHEAARRQRFSMSLTMHAVIAARR